jgi:spermidine/putrescine transport system ATP-binding protein
VTHDQEEALSMSDLVCVMKDGRIVQQGSPSALYDEPASRYVADFVGKSNFLAATLVEASAKSPRAKLASGAVIAGRWPKGSNGATTGDRIAVAVRPELIAMTRPGGGSVATDMQVEATVKNRIFLGENTEYLVAAGALGDILVLTPKRLEAATGRFAPGDLAIIGWPESAAVMLMDE